MGKKILNLGIGLALLGLVGVAIYYRAFYERDPGRRSEAGQMAVDLAEAVELLEAERSSEQDSQVADEEAESVQGSALESPEERRALWEAVRSAIEEARHARIPASEANDLAQPDQSGEPTPNYGSLDPSYIRDAMEEMIPLLTECYDLAREEAPELQGRLVLNYTIGGEPDVGGVVEEVDIDEESELRHPLLDECVRETIYTAELPAPESGGQVHVSYPLNFSPEEPDEMAD